MSEAALSSSPTKSLSSWWRNFKTSSRDSEPHNGASPNFLSIPNGTTKRPGLNRSSASSSAVPGISPNKAATGPAHSDYGISIPPQYAESPIFGVPLNVSLRYANVKISLSDRTGENFVYGHVPVIIAKCAVFLKQNARDTEGIFRIPGSVRRIRMLQDLFNTPPTFGKDLDWNGFMIHDAANLLKRYLATLPDPIIPRQKYMLFREPLQTKFLEIRDYMNYYSNAPNNSQSHGEATPPTTPPPKPSDEQVEAAVTIYENLIFALPRSSQQLLLYLIDLLSVFAAQSEHNRMPAYNLAAIFQPSVLTITEHDMNPEESQISRIVIEFLIENSVALLKRTQDKAIEKHELEKENGVDESNEESVRDYTPVEENATPTNAPPPLMISGPTEPTDGSSGTPFAPSHARRHSKSLSSANPPSLLLHDPLPKFLRRQRSTRSRASSSGSKSPNEESSGAHGATNDIPDQSTDAFNESHIQLRQHTRSPPGGEEDRKSRFRRSLMVLLPGKDSNAVSPSTSRNTSPLRPEMNRSPSWFARISGSGSRNSES